MRWLERVSEWEKCSGIANLLVQGDGWVGGV